MKRFCIHLRGCILFFVVGTSLQASYGQEAERPEQRTVSGKVRVLRAKETKTDLEVSGVCRARSLDGKDELIIVEMRLGRTFRASYDEIDVASLSRTELPSKPDPAFTDAGRPTRTGFKVLIAEQGPIRRHPRNPS